MSQIARVIGIAVLVLELRQLGIPRWETILLSFWLILAAGQQNVFFQLDMSYDTPLTNSIHLRSTCPHYRDNEVCSAMKFLIITR
jgi:hypothetical protein